MKPNRQLATRRIWISSVPLCDAVPAVAVDVLERLVP